MTLNYENSEMKLIAALNNEPENKLLREKNEVKFECKRLEMKLRKLDAELNFFDEQESEILKRRDTNGDSTQIMIDKNHSLDLGMGSQPQSKSGFITEDGGSRLLDFISSQSILSGVVTEPSHKAPTTKRESLNEPVTDLCCQCQDLIQAAGTVIMPSETVSSSQVDSELGRDILQFQREVTEINRRMRPFYEQVHQIVRQMVSKVYSRPFTVEIFGSCANGLNLPGSDLDLLVILHDFEEKIQQDKEQSELRSQMAEHNHPRKHSEQLLNPREMVTVRKYTGHSGAFQNKNSFNNIPGFPVSPMEGGIRDFELKMASEQILEEIELNALRGNHFEEAKFLRNAVFPVLKLKTNQELGSLMVDLTIKDSRHLGMQCVKLVRGLQSRLPRLRPLVLVLKQLLNAANLSDPYLGGLSSYGLVLMVAAFLKNSGDLKTKKSKGKKPTSLEKCQKKSAHDGGKTANKTENKNISKRGKEGHRKRGGKHKKRGKRISLWNLQNNEVSPTPQSLIALEPSSKTIQDLDSKLIETKRTLSTAHLQPSRKCSVHNSSSPYQTQMLGTRLIGFLRFFGAEFDYATHKVKLDPELPEDNSPFQQVTLTRNPIIPSVSTTPWLLASVSKTLSCQPTTSPRALIGVKSNHILVHFPTLLSVFLG